ncbi:MAG TPA: protein YgfX [Paraburkholderia sp.]|nr:protein YgfX [Paraburkholderia sp.]
MIESGAPRITARRSTILRAVSGLLVLVATLAVFTCVSSHVGVCRAVPLTLAMGALLGLRAVRFDQSLPAEFTIGSAELSAWDRTGRLVAQGRIAGCSQWSGYLLILSLAAEHGRKRTLLLFADALPASAFRELAVRGRRGAGA